MASRASARAPRYNRARRRLFTLQYSAPGRSMCGRPGASLTRTAHLSYNVSGPLRL
jgi:hypothetical protein